jgi:ribosomal protein S18 acetylase RimI-like enzyme
MQNSIFTERERFTIVEIKEYSPDILNWLSEVYASTRMQELAQTDWTDEQKKQFTDHQFYAQHDYYQKVYPEATYNAIMQGDKMIGRLYVNLVHPSDIRIIDIAILPEYRNQSIGTDILKNLQQFCRAEKKTLSIHVEQFNPAKRLYERLSFMHAETYDQVYILMKWHPEN